MSKKFSIIALSVLCVDFFPEQNKIYIGGNSLNFAVQCLNEGLKNISVLGCIGYDKYGDMIADYLKKTAIDISHLHRANGNTASNKIYISKTGDRYFKENSWDGGLYESYRFSNDDLKFIKTHDIIATTLFDPNFNKISLLTKECRIVADSLDTKNFKLIEDNMPKLDILFISTEKEHLDTLKKIADKHKKLIVVTLGEEGSIAFYNNKTYKQKAVPVKNIIDTTGCGDSFQAAFTCSYFKNHNIQKALKNGAIAASKVLSFIGAVK